VFTPPNIVIRGSADADFQIGGGGKEGIEHAAITPGIKGKGGEKGKERKFDSDREEERGGCRC